MEKLLDAIYLATEKHQHQTRKDKQTPYIAHALAVALILSEITNDEDTIIAGILHDLIEDTDVTKDDIEKKFGKNIADIVYECSEKDKSKTWKERKQEAIDGVKNLSAAGALVKSADTLHNIYESTKKVAELGLPFFDNFRASAQDKIANDKRKLDQLKRYHKDIPLIPLIEKNLTILEKLL